LEAADDKPDFAAVVSFALEEPSGGHGDGREAPGAADGALDEGLALDEKVPLVADGGGPRALVLGGQALVLGPCVGVGRADEMV
jgi:hypothetical protein